MAGVRQFDEGEMLAKALDLFWKKGLGGTTMLDLAAATGIQRGSLYNAYHGKETLFLLAFESYAARVLKAVRQAFAEPNPRRALQAFLEVGIVNMAKGHPPRGCLTTKTATEPDVADTPVQMRLRALLDEMEAIAAEALSKKGARELLVLTPAQTARVAVTFSRGLAVMERVRRDSRILRQSAQALVGALVRDEDGPGRRRPAERRGRRGA